MYVVPLHVIVHKANLEEQELLSDDQKVKSEVLTSQVQDSQSNSYAVILISNFVK